MKTGIIVLAAMGLAAGLQGSAMAAERTFERTLTVSAGVSLSVDTGSGNIQLHAGSDTQVHVVGRIHGNNSHGFFGGDNGGDLEKRMQRIADNPPIRQAGGEVKIGDEHGERELYRNLSVDYEISVPRGAAIHAESGSGDVTVEGVGASLKAHTGSGNIHARGIGGAVSLDTGSGDVELRDSARADVRAQTGSGNIKLAGIAGGLRAETGSGNIEIAGEPTADWKLETGSGNIRMELGPSAHFVLDAHTGSGSIHTDQPITMRGSLDKQHIVGSVNGGGSTLRAGTGSGDIEVR